MKEIIQMMVTAVMLAISQPADPTPIFTPPPDNYTGSLSRYDPQVMERVIEWRYEHNVPAGFDPWPTYATYVAVVDCRNVGRSGWMTLTIEGETRPPERIYVTDCATPGTPAAEWMEREQIAAEIDYGSWVRFGIEDGKGAWAEIVLDDDTMLSN
jgi:hypothetical protein